MKLRVKDGLKKAHSQLHRSQTVDVLTLAGVTSMTAGIAMLSIPAALIVLGVLLLGIVLVTEVL